LALKQSTVAKPRTSLGRSFLLALAIIGGTGLTGADEIVVSAPFIALNETLGLWAGWLASAAVWATAGFLTLILVDLIWPQARPTVLRLWQKIGLVSAAVLERLTTYFAPFSNLLTVSLAVGLLAGTGASVYLFKEYVASLLWEHRVMVGLVCGVVFGIFLLLVTYEWGGRQIERFVAFVPNILRRRLRLAAKLVAGLAILVYMGPVLSRPFLIPLGVRTKGWAYVLTFVAAPCFTLVWYPFYNFGVWDTIQRILF